MNTTSMLIVSLLALRAGGNRGVCSTSTDGNEGLKTEPISSLSLSKQGLNDLAQREMRVRQLTVDRGGIVAIHSHKERPALTYIMKGTFTEHRKGAPDRIYKPGEVIVETTDVDQRGEKMTTEPVVLISVDLFKE